MLYYTFLQLIRMKKENTFFYYCFLLKRKTKQQHNNKVTFNRKSDVYQYIVYGRRVLVREKI